jgi:hypothetical protein
MGIIPKPDLFRGCSIRLLPRNAIRLLLLTAFAFSLVSLLPLSARAGLLTNAAQVLSLSADQALQKVPVSVKGIVTAAEPMWNGKFFLQDDTSGVFVGNSTGSGRAEPGDVLEVTGLTHPGAYAPIITSAKWKRVGKAALPEPRRVPLEQVMSGVARGNPRHNQH